MGRVVICRRAYLPAFPHLLFLSLTVEWWVFLSTHSSLPQAVFPHGVPPEFDFASTDVHYIQVGIVLVVLIILRYTVYCFLVIEKRD